MKRCGARQAARRWLLGWAVGLAGLCAPAALHAQDADPRDVEIQGLEAENAVSLARAGSADCTVACAALGAMGRATDRICELDPGERCANARRKVDEARRRVLSRCPECAQPTGPSPTGAAAIPPLSPPAPSPVRPPEPMLDDAAGADDDHGDDAKEAPRASGHERETLASQASAPAPEAARGGCAACALGAPERRVSPAGLAGLSLVLLAVARRRRRR